MWFVKLVSTITCATVTSFVTFMLEQYSLVTVPGQLRDEGMRVKAMDPWIAFDIGHM